MRKVTIELTSRRLKRALERYGIAVVLGFTGLMVGGYVGVDLVKWGGAALLAVGVVGYMVTRCRIWVEHA